MRIEIEHLEIRVAANEREHGRAISRALVREMEQLADPGYDTRIDRLVVDLPAATQVSGATITRQVFGSVERAAKES